MESKGSFLPESDELGELLFSRREITGIGVSLALLGFFAILAYDLISGELLAFSGVVLVFGVFLILSKTQYHEFGVVVSWGHFRMRKLLYKDIHKMTCMYSYPHLRLWHLFGLTLCPRSNAKWLSEHWGIHQSMTYRYDAEMSNVRDRISNEIAKKLIEELVARGEVRWTDEVTIGRTSIKANVSEYIFSSRSIEYNYCDIGKAEIEDYVLTIYPLDKRMPEVSIACSAENFFPCLVVFESLLSRHRSSPNIE